MATEAEPSRSICAKCGKPLPDGATFCSDCGAASDVTPPESGANQAPAYGPKTDAPPPSPAYRAPSHAPPPSIPSMAGGFGRLVARVRAILFSPSRPAWALRSLPALCRAARDDGLADEQIARLYGRRHALHRRAEHGRSIRQRVLAEHVHAGRSHGARDGDCERGLIAQQEIDELAEPGTRFATGDERGNCGKYVQESPHVRHTDGIGKVREHRGVIG